MHKEHNEPSPKLNIHLSMSHDQVAAAFKLWLKHQKKHESGTRANNITRADLQEWYKTVHNILLPETPLPKAQSILGMIPEGENRLGIIPKLGEVENNRGASRSLHIYTNGEEEKMAIHVYDIIKNKYNRIQRIAQPVPPSKRKRY